MTPVQSDVKMPGEWIKRKGHHIEAASLGTQYKPAAFPDMSPALKLFAVS